MGRLLDEIIPHIRKNCLISDAKYWGFYSTCGLLLRMRELYKFDRGLRPWDAVEHRDVAEWMGETERRWKELEALDFSEITINGQKNDPFDVGGINEALRSEGLIYGAGYGIYGKPVFFVAGLEGEEDLDGYNVFIAGREHARDLSLHPAMLQGDTVIARKDAAAVLIWEKFEEMKAGKKGDAIRTAFSHYGVTPETAPESWMERVVGAEIRAYVRHELGEAYEGRRLGPRWKEMLSSLKSFKAEIFARTVKDVMSDASEKGMLKYIIDTKNAGSLAFYILFLGGMRRLFAGPVTEAFKEILSTGNWEAAERARQELYEKASVMAGAILETYESKPEALNEKIEEMLAVLPCPKA